MTPTILVVDDSLTVRMDLTEALNAAGFRAVPCATVGAAREALAHEAVALVVLDVLLPDAEGIDLLREIRADARSQDLPVLMLSTEAEISDRVRGLTLGADEYVGKPYDTGYIVARAREMVERRHPTPASADVATVLLIDDSLTFREELRRALEAGGLKVVTASSGEDGLRVAAAVRPSAIIVDGVMPGIDGPTVIRRVRLDAALRRTPCLLLTGSSGGEAELLALDAGADAFVRKEEDIDVVLSRLRAVLRSAAEAADPGTASLLGPKRILAVDDSDTYLNAIADALRGEGYDVVLARSGEQALELLAIQPVDCILLDLLMPGLSGQDTCRRIKAAPVLRDIPVIMLTARDDRESTLGGLSAGADDFIAKSSDLPVLKARLRAQLRRRQFEDENRRIRERLLRAELEATEARAARELAETRAQLVEELERKNRELEAFSYSVSHDLRAPLRGIDGFSQALVEDYGSVLDEQGCDYLNRIRRAAQRMGRLIDELLALSRVGRGDLRRENVDLSALARAVIDELRQQTPGRDVLVSVEQGLNVEADSHLLHILLDNLLGNAWKFTAHEVDAEVALGVEIVQGERAFFVRDNGVGFDMQYASKLFAPFQRLHTESDFPGTGIGLATVQRVVDRHGGRVWAESAPGCGTTFRFTLKGRRVSSI